MHFLRLKLTYFQYRWYLTTVALDHSSFVHLKMLFYDKIIKNRRKSIPRDEFIRGSTLLKDFSVLPSTGLTHLNTNVDTTLPYKRPRRSLPHICSRTHFFSFGGRCFQPTTAPLWTPAWENTLSVHSIY